MLKVITIISRLMFSAIEMNGAYVIIVSSLLFKSSEEQSSNKKQTVCIKLS